MAIMTKERNIQIFSTTYDFLQSIKPEDVQLEKYFVGDNRDFKTLTDVYIQFLKSAQNYQAMPNIINFDKRKEVISNFLFGYDYEKVAEMSEDVLYKSLRQRFSPGSSDTRKNSWYKWSCAAVDSAKFICGFDDAKDFMNFVQRFDYNADSRMALPLLIKTKIRGIGFALACDALKELGYINYPKPDVHLIDVFREAGICKGSPISVYESVVRMADDNGETPYKVDKVFWLICTGNYYHEGKSAEGYKQELIALLQSRMKRGENGMSGSIMDSPWVRLMDKCYESRGNYPVDAMDDENPALDKAFKELKAEIQTERKAALEANIQA